MVLSRIGTWIRNSTDRNFMSPTWPWSRARLREARMNTAGTLRTKPWDPYGPPDDGSGPGDGRD